MTAQADASGVEHTAALDKTGEARPQSLRERYAGREPRLDTVCLSARPVHATAFMRSLWICLYCLIPVAAFGIAGKYLDLISLEIIAFVFAGIAVCALLTAFIALALPAFPSGRKTVDGQA